MTHPSPAPDHPLYAHYDALWRESLAAMQANGVVVDSHLADKASDGRRGLTVLGRPDAATRDAVHAVLEELAAISPGVYRYRPDDLHVTILSLFTSTTDWAPHLAQLPRSSRLPLSMSPTLVATLAGANCSAALAPTPRTSPSGATSVTAVP